MSFNLVIQAEALFDIKEAFNWYEEQKPGLGDELINEIEICCEKITAHPEYYSFVNEKYRRIKTNRFPYLIVYEIENDTITINAVLHAKRKSKY